jgi:hypothetical protein
MTRKIKMKDWLNIMQTGRNESGAFNNGRICWTLNNQLMEKNIMIFVLLIIFSASQNVQAQKQETLKREVTLYNPYKPSLSEAVKKGSFPDMTDTSSVRLQSKYDVSSVPFMPEYSITPIKAATLLSDPLEKLYKSYVKLGLGNHGTPLGEISITNERSKKGAIGLYGRHFSTNDKIKLQNDDRVFAGYMDNDASLFGRKFFRKSVLEGSFDFTQKVRHAYGYDTSVVEYGLDKKMTRLGYNNVGATIGLASSVNDSLSLAYDIRLGYKYFYNSTDRFQHKFSLEGSGAKTYNDFYVGSGLLFDYFRQSDSLNNDPGFIFALSPFVIKSSQQWNFKLGLQIFIDNSLNDATQLHLYPDVRFGFNIVPSYISFFTGLSGKMERNEPLNVIAENPFVMPGGPLFRIPNTDHKIIFKAGLQGNNGIEGNYELSASYSLIDDMLFFTNYVDEVLQYGKGNFFLPVSDEVEIFNIHGETNGKINDRLTFLTRANYYRYTLTENEYAWNKPDWDAQAGIKYNLRDKIIAGAELTAQGSRRFLVSEIPMMPYDGGLQIIKAPVHFNLNLNAEYRYTKILSFWTKFNNISYRRYYEWAYYPSQQFLFMIGFTYSL